MTVERQRSAVHALGWSLIGLGPARWERLVVAVTALAGVTYLSAVGRLSEQAFIAIYSAVVGYVLGHGAGAAAERRSNGAAK